MCSLASFSLAETHLVISFRIYTLFFLTAFQCHSSVQGFMDQDGKREFEYIVAVI